MRKEIIGDAVLYLGDCIDVMRTMPDNSVDSIVTDPPYGLSKEPDMLDVLRHWMAGDDYQHKGGGFMGKGWDSFVPGPAIWRECMRVLKPGGHLLAFFGSRTYDMGTLAIRLAGFEVRDQIMWVYGEGFPKSMDVSKAIDKAAGAEREPGKPGRYASRRPRVKVEAVSAYQDGVGNAASALVTAPATDAARQWQGWGTALKPAHEPIVVARKPLIGTVAANVLEHGTGALNIDECRVGMSDADREAAKVPQPVQHNDGRAVYQMGTGEGRNGATFEPAPAGRWPANVILSYNEDEFELRAGVTDEQKKELLKFLYENT